MGRLLPLLVVLVVAVLVMVLELWRWARVWLVMGVTVGCHWGTSLMRRWGPVRLLVAEKREI